MQPFINAEFRRLFLFWGARLRYGFTVCAIFTTVGFILCHTYVVFYCIYRAVTVIGRNICHLVIFKVILFGQIYSRTQNYVAVTNKITRLRNKSLMRRQ